MTFDTHIYFGGSLLPGVANTAANITAAMEARGIENAVVFSAHACNVDPVSGNRILRVILEKSPNLYGCLVAHVNRVDPSITVMREMMPNRKFVGAAIVGIDPELPVSRLLADDLINAYRRYSKPLFLFTPNAECVRAALDIAKSYPMLKVVFLGMGGKDWRTAIAAAHAATNVYLETSGTLDRAKLPAAIETLGPHRILFGSGSPHVDAAAAAGLLQDSDLTEESRKKILFENAQRLFGLLPDSSE